MKAIAAYTMGMTAPTNETSCMDREGRQSGRPCQEGSTAMACMGLHATTEGCNCGQAYSLNSQ